MPRRYLYLRLVPRKMGSSMLRILIMGRDLRMMDNTGTVGHSDYLYWESCYRGCKKEGTTILYIYWLNYPDVIILYQPLLKKLQRHILGQVPPAKIKSTRFHSVPFQNLTSKLPTSNNKGMNSTPKSTSSAKQTHPHDRN
jgi:hypothetical protein